MLAGRPRRSGPTPIERHAPRLRVLSSCTPGGIIMLPGHPRMAPFPLQKANPPQWAVPLGDPQKTTIFSESGGPPPLQHAVVAGETHIFCTHTHTPHTYT